MSPLNIRLAFFFVYFAFLVINCGLIILGWQRFFITTDGMNELLGNLRSVYIAPMTIVLVGVFEQMKGSPEEGSSNTSFPLLAAALLLVAFWNMIITYPFFYLVWVAGPQAMSIGWLSDYWRSAADFANFLATASLTYFFVKKS